MAVFNISPGMIESYLIGKGLNPSDARKFSTQPWVQDFAKRAVSGDIPKNVPPLNAETVASYKEQAKRSGQPLMDFVQSKVAPTAPLMAGMGSRSVGQALASLPPQAAPTMPAAVPIPNTSPAPPQSIQASVEQPSIAGFMQAPTSGTALSWSPKDRDLAIRTAYGEAGGGGPGEIASVADVIRNRATMSGMTPGEVVKQRGQFEPWAKAGTRAKMMSLSGEKYDSIAKIVDPVLSGEKPGPTPNATYFYAPKAQAALGRPAPAWGREGGTMSGRQKFFDLPWGGKQSPELGWSSPFLQVAQKTDDGISVPPVPPGGQQFAGDYTRGQVPSAEPGMSPTLGAFPPTFGAPGSFPTPDPSMPLPTQNPGAPPTIAPPAFMSAGMGRPSWNIPSANNPQLGGPGLGDTMVGPKMAATPPSLAPQGVSPLSPPPLPPGFNIAANAGFTSPAPNIGGYLSSLPSNPMAQTGFSLKPLAMGPANPAANMGLPMPNPMRTGAYTPQPSTFAPSPLGRSIGSSSIPGNMGIAPGTPPSAVFGGGVAAQVVPGLGSMRNGVKVPSGINHGPTGIAQQLSRVRQMYGPPSAIGASASIMPYGMNVGF